MKQTPFHDAHIALGAKMGPFAGYDMPLYYKDGVMREHEWTRAQVGLFDVSHMGQVMVSGPGACGFFEHLTPSAFAGLPDGRAKYTVLTNASGGVIDDLIVTRLGRDRFFAVVNAGCKDKDFAWFEQNLPKDATMEIWHDRALIAVQGPMAEGALRTALGVDTVDMPYMWAVERDGLLVSRLGYTGEDGFELSIPHDRALAVWDALLALEAVRPVGLAARDSLRLEMGYPLYGHELDEKISPVEAGLDWIIGRDKTGYIGAVPIDMQMKQGPICKRVGVRLTDKGVAREGAELRDQNDKPIGSLTSGGYAPSLKQSIGMGYVRPDMAVPGTKIFAHVRGNNIAAEICALPFMPARTKSMKRSAA